VHPPYRRAAVPDDAQPFAAALASTASFSTKRVAGAGGGGAGWW
jgi:hypothetical protein